MSSSSPKHPSYGAIQHSTTRSPSPDPRSPSPAHITWTLAGLWSSVCLAALGSASSILKNLIKLIPTLLADGTVIATLQVKIASEFSQSQRAAYLGTSYLLSLCCFTPLYGRLADVLGRKGAMLLALFFFSSGTIACGFVPSMSSLIAARAIAGMGGGGVMTVSTIVTTDLIPLRKRGLYQGMANILYGLGAGLGGPLGGWINDRFGWRAAFYLQGPFLILSASLCAWKINIRLPPSVEELSLRQSLRRIDVLGSVTLAGFVGCFLVGFSIQSTEDLPWSHPLVFSCFFASVIFGIAFYVVESHWAYSPVMPFRLMKQRTPFAVSISNLFASMVAFSMLYNVPLYLSAVKLYSSSSTGSHLIPHSIAIPCGSVAAGWLMRRTGKLTALTLVAAASSVLANIMVVFWNDKTAPWHLWFDLVPQALGMAAFITSTLIAMIASVEREDMPVATGITYLFRTTGQVLGVSLSGALLQSVLVHKLRQRIDSAEVDHLCDTASSSTVEIPKVLTRRCRHSVANIPDLAPEWRRIATESYADALRVVFIFQTALSLLTFLACLPIQENPLPGAPPTESEDDCSTESE
ncbi:Multidrug resistance protein fnx1 [Mycena kentingensis (nom. inval.)]|nr:Multidrug resistance protein fnx1 [Mycena kentingensis (nom. inval.)]